MYTEEDLRKAFRAGVSYGEHQSYFDQPYNEDEYIEGLNAKTEEKTYPFTAFHLMEKLGWESFCDVTGIDYYAKRNGYEVNDNEVFNIKESDVKEYMLQ